MVRHLVAWKLKEEFTLEQKRSHATEIKSRLEALKAIVPGVVSLEVIIDILPSSANADLILNSLFEDEAALMAYQNHPEHKKISAFVGALRETRTCVDYLE